MSSIIESRRLKLQSGGGSLKVKRNEKFGVRKSWRYFGLRFGCSPPNFFSYLASAPYRYLLAYRSCCPRASSTPKSIPSPNIDIHRNNCHHASIIHSRLVHNTGAYIQHRTLLTRNIHHSLIRPWVCPDEIVPDTVSAGLANLPLSS